MDYPHLRRWKAGVGMTGFDSGSNYVGQDLSDYWVTPFIQNRDSDTLTRSNFSVAWNILKWELGREERSSAEIHRIRHWAVGWVEQILIPAHDTTLLDRAEKLAAKLSQRIKS